MAVKGERPGSALILVLLGLLLLEAMILGSLSLAAQSAVAAQLAARRLHARLAAESAVREAFAIWPHHGWDTLAAGASDTRATTGMDAASIDVESLGEGRFVVRGAAPGMGVDRVLAQALVHVLPRDSMRALFDAALHVAGPARIEATAAIDGTGAVATAHCQVEPAPGVIAPPDALLIEPAAALNGAPPIGLGAMPVDGVSGIAFWSLQTLADRVVTGSATPAKAPCDDEDPNAWGDAGAGEACFVFAPGDLTVAGGEANALLVVLGRLRVTGGARLSGAVIAGSADILDGQLSGALRTFGGDTARIGGTVVFDPCAIEAALAAPAIRSPFARGPRLWLPAR